MCVYLGNAKSPLLSENAVLLEHSFVGKLFPYCLRRRFFGFPRFRAISEGQIRVRASTVGVPFEIVAVGAENAKIGPETYRGHFLPQTRAGTSCEKYSKFS